MITSFADLPLLPPLLVAAAELGFVAPTPVQAAALPPLLAGRDVVGRAPTGSGKTAAFGLAALQGVDLTARRVQVLVLSPTRELADQLAADLRALGRRLPGLRVVVATGGRAPEPQSRALREGCHVVVATPGRLEDHLRRGVFALDAVRVVVLDEADRLLELGFAAQLDAIRAHLPEARQTALFSATFPEGVARLVAGWTGDPVSVEAEAPTTVASFAAVVSDPAGAALALLRALQPESALVFCATKRAVDEVTASLVRAGAAAAALHGDRAPVERDRVMDAFRVGAVRVLVATDLAARGLDVAGLPLVVCLGPAMRPDDHVHRVGRTGRAGRAGVAWTLLAAGQYPPEGAALEALPVPAETALPPAAAWSALWVGAGRRDKVRPGDLLGALTGGGGVPGEAVGKLRVGEGWSVVAVAPRYVEHAARHLSRAGVKGRKVRVERGP